MDSAEFLPDMVSVTALLLKFSYLSWNIQSLPAKFNEFQEFINVLNHNNCSPDVICLQETWKIIDKNLFALPNYSLPETLQRSNSQGGGSWLLLQK